MLQEALGGEDVELIKEKTSALSQASMKIGEAMNKARCGSEREREREREREKRENIDR